ncbi:aromatic-ring-hydroxylating dioxygenase subunit beta [Parvularcula marina]|uniref:Ring-hydroxylating dioxygenase subunit beta n=1 Tax=Parvularcula marina TaxID=2292771 RepID=A0A371RLC0_9PROT|nr:aromatic-ring-hydroxylating dioxygenase subunit beta [Parvularcula marina]RFB06260.1 ring-hydroxylating dioxygenase subunit beta [Parvularcula marina]
MKDKNDAALRQDLRDFYEDYAGALDDVRLEDWVGFFADDAVYKVISRETHSQGLSHATIYCDGLAMIRDRAAAVQETAVFEPRVLRHFVGGPRIISRDGDEIAVTANFLITEALFDAEPQILMMGRYLDKLVERGGDLKFRERLAVYDNHRVRTTLVIPV